jgi:lysophospholipase L1-like esterase
MIPLGARVWIALGHTDMRKGMQGPALLRFNEEQIITILKEHNDDPRPSVWKADPDQIIAAVRRWHQTFESIH